MIILSNSAILFIFIYFHKKWFHATEIVINEQNLALLCHLYFLCQLNSKSYFLRFSIVPYNSSTLFARLDLRLGFKPVGPGFKLLIKTGSKLFTQSHSFQILNIHSICFCA